MFLLTQRIFAESAHFPDMSIFCWYSTFLLSHHQAFLRLVKFCWHSVFLLTQPTT